jgi:putative membrane protein (TIGR04086 family)
MRINWKRIVVAAICSELLLLVIRFPFLRYDGPGDYALNLLTHFLPLFLGGLWIARKIESRFVLHGVLVGIIGNLLLVIMIPLFMFMSAPTKQRVISLLISIPTKILGGAIGAYVGGRRRKKLLSAQTG